MSEQDITVKRLFRFLGRDFESVGTGTSSFLAIACCLECTQQGAHTTANPNVLNAKHTAMAEMVRAEFNQDVGRSVMVRIGAGWQQVG